MAWTAPRTWVNGELVNASLLNTHLRDNMLECPTAKFTTAGDLIYATAANAAARLGLGSLGQYLQAGAAAPLWAGISIAKSVTVVTLSTINETDVWTTTLTGGVLGTAGLITGKLFFLQSGGGYTMTMKMYYGATSISGTQIDNTSSGSPVPVDFFIMGDGATNAQRMGFAGFTQYDQGGNRKQTVQGYGTAAIDSTANQTLKFSLQQSNTSLALIFLNGFYMLR